VEYPRSRAGHDASGVRAGEALPGAADVHLLEHYAVFQNDASAEHVARQDAEELAAGRRIRVSETEDGDPRRPSAMSLGRPRVRPTSRTRLMSRLAAALAMLAVDRAFD
jgi:hypothetical protein